MITADHDNAFIRDLDDEGAASYLRLRPSYPSEALKVLQDTVGNHEEVSVIDIGAGSGQLTRLLAEHGYRTCAVEPSKAMRSALESQPWVKETKTRVVEGLAEDTGLPPQQADLITWAQCFHWFDTPQATEEAARLLRPGGVAAALWNQLDVRKPWVHRLTRIMRSGDVLARQKPPDLGPKFTDPRGTIVEWTDIQTPEQVMELGRTRSSYLRSSPDGRLKMQGNLHWYLYERLGFHPHEPIELPYRTFIWTATRI